MTIRKGEDWGEAGPLPDDGVVVSSDAEARAVVEEHRRANRPVPALGLVGGALWRTLGGTADPDRLTSPDARRLPVDLGSVLVDGRLFWFVAHLTAHRGWWRGRAVVAANAQWIGSWNVAPAGHPNDGRLDLLEADVPVGERLKVRARLASGTHLPHPAIRARKVDAVQLDLPPGTRVRLDGVSVGRAETLSIRTEPDALTVVVA